MRATSPASSRLLKPIQRKPERSRITVETDILSPGIRGHVWSLTITESTFRPRVPLYPRLAIHPLRHAHRGTTRFAPLSPARQAQHRTFSKRVECPRALPPPVESIHRHCVAGNTVSGHHKLERFPIKSSSARMVRFRPARSPVISHAHLVIRPGGIPKRTTRISPQQQVRSDVRATDVFPGAALLARRLRCPSVRR